MSQYWGAYHGVALVLTEPEFETFLDNYEKSYSNIKDTIEETSLQECLFHNGKNPEKTFDITPVSTDDCSGMILFPFINKNGNVNERIFDEKNTLIQDIIYHDLRAENCYAIFSDKDFTSGRVFNPKYRYNSYDELLEEFQNKLKAYLPADFDWNSHIGDFSYACFA